MKPYFLSIGLIFILAGCMRSQIEGSGTPQETNGHEIIHGSFYAFVWKDYKIKKAGNGLGIYRVIYHSNYLYSAVSVLSLGLYVPQEIEWWVQAPSQEDYNGQLMPPRNRK